MSDRPKQPGAPLSALLRYYDFRPERTTFGTYVSPTPTIPFSEPDGPRYEHTLGATWGPAFTIRETLPPFVTAPWMRAAAAVAADVRAREQYRAYLMRGIDRRPVEEW